MSFTLTAQARSLLGRQEGVATLAQLVLAGSTRAEIRAQVDARRWTRWGRHCVVTHNFVPTRRQLTWVALLDQPPPVALAGFSALEVAGFRYFGREPEAIHVVVRRGVTYHRFPGVQIHESRRFQPIDIVRADGPPRLAPARSALDAGAWQPNPRYACGILAAVVQQGICTPEDLSVELEYVGRIRHKRQMRLAIWDVAGGAQALSELDVAGLCRRFRLQPPCRQVLRRDRAGRKRYLDCEWTLPDGRVVVLEIDGSHHREVASWEADLRRERGVVTSGRRVLRATANEARYDQAAIAADLVAIGVPLH